MHILVSKTLLFSYYLAAISKDMDIMYQFQQAFNHFIKTGQVWALLIGLALGYLFKSFTSY